MRKHRVIFYSPGTLFSESTTKEIDSWNPIKAVEMAEDIKERHGAKPYGFSFITVVTHDDVSDGEGGFLRVEPKEVDRSGVYFLGGRLETYTEVVKRNDPKEDILRTNMRSNEYWIICINTNSWRSTMPFNEEDFIVDASGKIVEHGNNPDYIAYRAEQLAKRRVESGY